jgi:hypothetical protein
MGAGFSPLGFLVCLLPLLFCVLLTGPCLPSSPGPEGRKKIAHGVSRGNRTEVESPEPRRGERNGPFLESQNHKSRDVGATLEIPVYTFISAGPTRGGGAGQ